MEKESKQLHPEKETVSFSMQMKEELAAVIPTARHCQIAELLALLLCCAGVSEIGDKKILRIQTENETVLRKVFTFLQKTFNIESVQINIINEHAFELTSGEAQERIFAAVKLPWTEGPMDMLEADGRVLAKNCCRRAFIRGCFLASGSISAPQKGYHFEIVAASLKRAEQIQQVIRLCGVDAKMVQRKKYHVVYVKESEQIADMLSLMEAPRARMEFENVRILKDVRNSVNRKVNCEAANISKTASAAYEQIEDIRCIIRHHCLEGLPEHLIQAAQLRLEKPDASLTELGQMMSPPVSKSGINHRMKKLKAIADQIREKEEDYDNKENDG